MTSTPILRVVNLFQAVRELKGKPHDCTDHRRQGIRGRST